MQYVNGGGCTFFEKFFLFFEKNFIIPIDKRKKKCYNDDTKSQ